MNMKLSMSQDKLRMVTIGIAMVAMVAIPQMAWSHCGACGAEAEHAHGKSIVDVAQEAGTFKTLLAAAEVAGLVETLSHNGPFTVFAPSDDAFKKLPEGTVGTLLANKEKLKSLLLYHVVAGTVPAEKAMTLKKAPSVFGQDIPITKTDKGLFVAGAKIVTTDIEASNGVIHVIDEVMMPSNIIEIAGSNDDFTTLTAAIKAAGLVETLNGDGPFTVFAPTNAAFAKLPEGTVESLLKPEGLDQLRAILTGHVVAGAYSAEDVSGVSEVMTVQGSTLPLSVCEHNGVQVANASVIAADVTAFNGVIHVIDSVILPKS
jgi:uncharacterized surface protein with fasciclin (FAS1) repeats